MATQELPRTRLFESVSELLHPTTVVAIVPLGDYKVAPELAGRRSPSPKSGIGLG